MERVPDGHGNTALDSRPDRRRVKDLRAEEGELGRLRVAHFGDGARGRDDAWVGRQDSVDVRPDLDHADREPGVSQGAPEDGGGGVRAAAAQRRRRTAGSRADEAARDDDASRRKLRKDARGDAAGRLGFVGARGSVRRVGREDLARVHPDSQDARGAERRGEEAGGDQLAHGEERIRGSRGDFFE